MSNATRNPSSDTSKGPKLNPGAKTFEPTTTSSTSVFADMSALSVQVATKDTPEDTSTFTRRIQQEYDNARKSAFCKQHRKAGNKTAIMKKRGENPQEIQDWASESWRVWDEKWPEAPVGWWLQEEEGRRKQKEYTAAFMKEDARERWRG